MRNILNFLGVFLVTLITMRCFGLDARAAVLGPNEVRIWKQDSLHLTKDFIGVRGATVGDALFADLDSDGTDEIVLASGMGTSPTVWVFGLDGKKRFQFAPFTQDARNGLSLATGDVDGDGVPNIIVGQRMGGMPQVAVYTHSGLLIKQFFVFDATRTFGAHIAAGDIDGDGTNEIIAAEGPRGSRHVRIYRGDGSYYSSFLAFSANEDGAGVVLTTYDANDDKKDEVYLGQASQGSRVEVWDPSKPEQPRLNWKAFAPDFLGGVRISAATGSTTLTAPIAVSSAGAGLPVVRAFTPHGALVTTQNVFETSYDGGVIVAQGRDSDGVSYRLATPTLPVYYPTSGIGKSIQIGLKEQRLFAWEDGYLLRSYFISSGLAATPTPVGEFSVLRKVEYVNYTRIYGENDPRNYSYPNTRWNLMFKPRYYIHSAWWHSNFGRPMSHGCVNTHIEDAKWTYLWADEGIPVTVSATNAIASGNSSTGGVSAR